MKRKIIIISILILTLLISGCCPETCDDKNECTTDYCSKETNFSCMNEIIKPCEGNGICEEGEFLKSTDCPTCDDSNPCTDDIYDFKMGKCTHLEFKPCLGNKICEEDEYPSIDCPNCDDKNKCTKDLYNYNTNKCENKLIKPCDGNKICEKGESPKSKDCPNCNDNEKCTKDSYDYSLKKCVNEDMIPCCGNNVCERIDGESYSVCSDDCEKNDDDAIQDCINKYSSSDILRSNCFNDVIDKYGYSDKIIDYEKEKCQNKYDSLYSLCLKKIAEEYAIEGICGELSSWSEKDDCYENVAVKKQDYNICLKIELGLSLGDCFYYVNLKAKSDCSGLNGDYKIMCLAKIEGNSFKCDDISDSQLKTRCRSMSFRVPTRYDDYIYW